MTCRARVGILLAVCACVDDVPVVEIAVPAFVDVTPRLPFEAEDGLATFRWELLESPEGSRVVGVTSVDPLPTFQFDRRGSYLLDRWIVAGLSERLTYHVVVAVSGVPPVASVNGTTSVAIGDATLLDASSSSSRERRPLTYQWQLSTRPALSQLVLPVNDTSTLSIAPDVVGSYVVEVAAFDGELWSDPVTITVEGHQ